MVAATATSAPLPRKRAARQFRHAMVVLHRYVGLAMATFLVVACLTGSAIVFLRELDDWINAPLAYVEPPDGTTETLPRLALRERVAQQLPDGYSVWELPLEPVAPDASLRLSLHHVDESKQVYTSAYIDPYSGRLLGLRDERVLTDPRNIMALMYRLHDSLMLGQTGMLLLGITALLWTIDCFVGFYLTLPPSGTGNARRGWWARWAPAWLVRGGSMFAAIFSFHRAAGLWLWAVLFVFAWSSVAFLLHSVYEPVMDTVFHSEHGENLPELPEPRFAPRMSWEQALARGETLMAAEAQARGFTIAGPEVMSHEPHFGFFRYQVTSSLDPSSRGNTTVWMDSDTGRQVAFWAPTGRSSGETVDYWLTELHFGTVFGLAYRIFIFIVGIAAAALAVTGVVIWLKKRRGRAGKAKRQTAQP